MINYFSARYTLTKQQKEHILDLELEEIEGDIKSSFKIMNQDAENMSRRIKRLRSKYSIPSGKAKQI